MKNLKIIQQKLRNTIKPRSFLKSVGRSDNKDETKEQKDKFIEILEEYKLEYKEVYSLRKYLIYGFCITIIFILITFIYNTKSISDLLNINIIILATFLAEIIILIIYALKTYIPSPNSITDWAYMKEYFNLSPSGLGTCANLSVDYNKEDTLLFHEVFDPKTKNVIKILSDIELRGYKYWIFIYDNKIKKSIFNVTGNINNATYISERFFDTELKGWSIKVGEFDGYKHKDNKDLKIFFFVFDPIVYGNIGYPYWGSSILEIDPQVNFSSAYRLTLNKGTSSKLKYKGEGLNFKDLTWDKGKIAQKQEIEELDNIIKTVFETSRESILKVKKAYKLINVS